MKKRIFSIIVMAALLIGLIPAGALRISAVSSFEISDACLDMIKEFEGFSAKPYWDYRQWTVGYGTRAPAEHLERYQKEGISREEAAELLRSFMNEMGQELNTFFDKFGLNMNQAQFDALLSLTFNCGSNWLYETSNFRSAVIEGRTGNDFLFAMGQWSTAGGQVQRGLVRRRLIEINMYLNGIYSMDVPENYSYVLYDPNGGTSEIKVQAYDADLTAWILAEPTYEGHTFLGWYTEAEGGDKVELLDAGVRNYKLYAHWAEGSGSSDEPAEEEIVETPVDYQREIVSSVCNVLEKPVAGANVLSACKQGAVVRVVAEYTDAKGVKWGRIENSGWIDLSGTKEFSWDDAQQNGVKVTVTANDVNIRRGPGTNYARTGGVNKGDQLVIISTASGSGYTWGQFSDGWVCLKYTNYDDVVNENNNAGTGNQKPQETPVATGTVTVSDGLRIRSQAGTSYAIVGYLSNGARVEILEQKTAGGRPWGRVAKGWICLDYVKFDTAEPEQPSQPEEEKPQTQSGTVTGSDLRIRSGPGTNYEILGYMQKGDRVEIAETKTTGTTIWGKTAKGWISMDYVRLDAQEEPSVPPVEPPKEEPKPTVLKGTITGDHLRVRSGPGTNYEILSYLNTGDRVEITEQKTVGSMVWGRTEKGWISMDYVRLDDVQTESVMGVVTEDSLLRIRSGAGSGYSVVGYLNPGTKIEILEQKTVDGTKWGRVDKGWVNLAYVDLTGTTDKPAQEENKTTGTITADILNVRSGPGMDNGVVALYYQGDTVAILETKTVGGTKWGRTEKGWISMDYVR